MEKYLSELFVVDSSKIKILSLSVESTVMRGDYSTVKYKSKQYSSYYRYTHMIFQQKDMSMNVLDNNEDVMDVIAAVQEGDFDVVKDAIHNKLVSVNCTDSDGCTLLHWAAINNRVEIAGFLIENGLHSVGGGGVLFENPLQWSIRKKYYAMADLIMQKHVCDIAHKSAHGSDALHIACKLGDINAAYLILNWGGSPNSVDNGGDTPLLWLLKNRHGLSTFEIIKLLIKFGADVRYQNANDGNSALHLIAQNKTNLDFSLAFSVYQAGGGGVAGLENKAGLTPYTQAVHSENRLMARFLFDSLIYNFAPYWTSSAASASITALFFLFIGKLGCLYGLFYWSFLYVGISWSLLQWQIVDHRGRIDIGTFLGIGVSLMVTFYVFVLDFVSIYWKVMSLAALTGLLYVTVAFHTKKPQYAKSEDRRTMAALIVQSAPSEAPDEEADLLALHSDNASQQKVESRSPKRSLFVKDSFTGALTRVTAEEFGRANGDRSGAIYRKRSLGPRLCGSCLTDKRAIASTGSSCLSSSAVSSKKGAIGGISPDGVISIATHCNCCGMCVVDQDHHCLFLGNCVGKGNRRLYCVFLLLSALCCSLYFLAAKWTHYHVYCAQYKGNWFSQMLGVEYCMLTSRPAFCLLTWLAVSGALYLLLSVQMQISLVARETTLANAIKKRYEPNPPAPKRRMKNILQFVFNGTYHVTYPKKGAVKQESCCSKHGKCDSKATDQTQSPDAQEYSSALKMLSGIDSRLQAAEEGKAGGSSRPFIGNLPSSSGSRFPTNSGALPPPAAWNGDTRTAEPRPPAVVTNSDDTDDDDDGYDSEFVDSALNNYDKYYFHDEDSEGEDEEEGDRQGLLVSRGETAADSESGKDSSVGDEETALVRSRIRTDSLQLHKDSTTGISNKKGGVMRISSTERM